MTQPDHRPEDWIDFTDPAQVKARRRRTLMDEADLVFANRGHWHHHFGPGSKEPPRLDERTQSVLDCLKEEFAGDELETALAATTAAYTRGLEHTCPRCRFCAVFLVADALAS